MKLSVISELAPLSLAGLERGGLKKSWRAKLSDPNRPEITGYSGNTMLPFRSGNQYTPPKNPRHRKFLGVGNPSSTPINPGLRPEFKSGELQGRARPVDDDDTEELDTDEKKEDIEFTYDDLERILDSIR